jgi:riboflavin biosynthesis pyrimidine reductase
MTPLDVLFERPSLPRFGVPAALAALYGGDFGLTRPRLYANFVASVDGVVTLPGPRESGAVISGGSEPDRFVMGLLRASADAVVIGASTFRKAAGAVWLPESIFPAAAAGFAELRRGLGLAPQPQLVVVTASGVLDPTAPALVGALVVTTRAGERRLSGMLPSGTRVVAHDAPALRSSDLMDLLAAENLRVVLTEGGPSLFGQLLRDGVVDEIFLTTSPRLFGRVIPDGRKSLVDGVDLAGHPLELVSLRRHESHLFLRYTMDGAGLRRAVS